MLPRLFRFLTSLSSSRHLFRFFRRPMVFHRVVPCYSRHASRRPLPVATLVRRGLTIVELMIAITLTIVITSLMVRAFQSASEEMSLGRAEMEMHEQLRPVVERLREDLKNATCQPRMRESTEKYAGYFEVVEGLAKDYELADTPASFMGDYDDVLALTVRSEGQPFRGRWDHDNDPLTAPLILESYYAEVVWWVNFVDVDTRATAELLSLHGTGIHFADQFHLYRRVLLIRPDLTTTETNLATFLQNNDISTRSTGTALEMNSIEDLVKRENRFAHNTTAFPYEITAGLLSTSSEHWMLDNIAAFDLRVFSPTLPVVTADKQTITPADPGFDSLSGSSVTEGGYVDLGRLTGSAGEGYEFAPHVRSQFTTPTFCTWSPHYESNGIDEDGDSLIDEGTNGFDDDGVAGIDNWDERETIAPYPYALRSLQATIRLFDKKTKLIIQKTVRESFVPN